MESTSTPEGFRKSFNSCGLAAAGLMSLLFIVIIIMLVFFRGRDERVPEHQQAPAPATEVQPDSAQPAPSQ